MLTVGLKNLSPFPPHGPTPGTPTCSNSFPGLGVDVGLCKGCLQLILEALLLGLCVASCRCRVLQTGRYVEVEWDAFWTSDPTRTGEHEIGHLFISPMVNLWYLFSLINERWRLYCVSAWFLVFILACTSTSLTVKVNCFGGQNNEAWCWWWPEGHDDYDQSFDNVYYTDNIGGSCDGAVDQVANTIKRMIKKMPMTGKLLKVHPYTLRATQTESWKASPIDFQVSILSFSRK